MGESSAAPPRFIAIDVVPALETYAMAFGPADKFTQLSRLAGALSASEPWRTLAEHCAMVIAPEPKPTLAIMGRFDAAGEQRLLELERTLHNDLLALRYVTWEQVQNDVAELATVLRRHLGDDLTTAQFAAIPRGGLIVLGLLGYELGLSRAQLTAGAGGSGPTVIVDDCALTGLRLHEVIGELGTPEVIFAHLYSAPELRSALEDHPRVRSAFSARDLTDRAPALLGVDYPAWTERWRLRTGELTSWVGITERIAFPWSEPDATFWNEATQRDEAGWKLVPPAFCAGNAAFDETSLSANTPGSGTIRPASGVIWADVGSETLVADRASGRVYSLDGVATEMWRALIDCGDVDAAADRLIAEFDAPAHEITADLIDLVADLRKAGALDDRDLSSDPGEPTGLQKASSTPPPQV